MGCGALGLARQPSRWGGAETKGLKNCMHKHGDNLTHACIAALVKAGEVSQSEVDRRKAGK